MKAFLGYGALGIQIEAFLKEDNPQFEVQYFDDDYISNNLPSIPFNHFKDNILKYEWLITLGYKHLPLKQKLLNTIKENGGSFFSMIHKSAYVAPSANINEGVVVYPLCNIDKDVVIKECSLINNSVIISHNTTIGQCCYISPGVTISGNVSIGDGTFIGAGTIIANGITIGNNVVIGIGSVITKNIEDRMNVIGNPLKILGKPINLT
ncbi:MAG: acetyltransferase [Bacteroidetes bacterium]|mgnify:CR=1 FL=1|nr:acetyltransferase [Bacteroidota bacterium]MBK8674047.1 acetyltransferase [Bacteroidota bacterium]MBK9355706.1 acetyltransferase [Bacteroidota bacterium]MBK9633906.1 acetyltransferase [Bacteroidota bacterium]MBL0079422.1 acetyltransferase [Bacteroidota bacterium]